MSAKRAKQLRRLTKLIVQEQIAKGEQVSDETLYVEVKKNRKYMDEPLKLGQDPANFTDQTVINTDGTVTPPTRSKMQVADGTILTTPKSVRGIYKALKQQLRKTS